MLQNSGRRTGEKGRKKKPLPGGGKRQGMWKKDGLVEVVYPILLFLDVNEQDHGEAAAGMMP